MHTHAHAHIYLYVCVYICVCVYLRVHGWVGVSQDVRFIVDTIIILLF